MTFYLIADLAFECADPDRNTDEEFDRFTDAIDDALRDLEQVDEGIIDPDLTVVIADRWVSILMGINADTKHDAVRLFLANTRTVLHAVGCGIPDWPTFTPTEKVPTVRTADFADA